MQRLPNLVESNLVELSDITMNLRIRAIEDLASNRKENLSMAWHDTVLGMIHFFFVWQCFA